jgi:hypothetical protein
MPVFLQAQLPAVSFQHLRRDQDLFSSTYQTLEEDPFGFIWFGSIDGGGLYRYDGYELKYFTPDPGHMETSLTGTRIAKIYMLDSTLYVGTQFGFSMLDVKSGLIKNFNNQYDKLPDYRIGVTWDFLNDTIHNTMWIGTRHGLATFNPDSSAGEERFRLLRPAEPMDGEYWPIDISDLHLDNTSHDLLWISSHTGLYCYSISKNTYERFVCPQYKDVPHFIVDLYQDKDGWLWLTVRDGLVFAYHHGLKQWKTFEIPESNPDPVQRYMYNMRPGYEDDLWLCTRSSVGRLNTESGTYESWRHDPSLPEGLLPNGLYRDLFADRHGRLWVASWHGVQYARQTFLPPSSKVTNLKVAVTDVDITPPTKNEIKPLIYTDLMSLDQNQRDVTFRFVLPNPVDPSKVGYRYMLKGFDRDWIETDQRTVRYPRLSGGKYAFLVTGREGDATEWLPVTELGIEVEKRIIEYWWFWVLVVGIMVTIAVLVYRFLISRARKEEKLRAEFDHKLSEIQMQALRAQMNPHFLFNSLNSIKYFAISKSKDETATYLSKFALLVRNILNNSKSKTISLQDELEALRLYIEIEHLRLEGKFDYTIDIDSSIHVRQAQIPPMILQHYVENALWHGLMHKEGTGKLLVQVRDLGNQIQCIIEDNGVGRARAAEIRKAQMDHKKSVGMQITGDRIALINRIYQIDTQVHVVDLTDHNGTPLGTRVVINIPLIQDEEE